MGAGASATASNVEQNVRAQFHALLPDGASALSLSQVLRFEPIAGATLQMRSLAVLFLIDRDMDGMFGLGEVIAFFELCSRMLSSVGRSDLDVSMQAHALLRLHDFLKTEGGNELFCNWFVKVFLDGPLNSSHATHSDFVSRDVAHGIHHVLQLESSNGYDAQGFLDVLQRMGEEEQLMDIGREDLDDVVPVSVVICFAKHYAASICKNMDTVNAASTLDPA
jgi:hypothetical protein